MKLLNRLHCGNVKIISVNALGTSAILKARPVKYNLLTFNSGYDDRQYDDRQ